ncbi:MAG: squalene synthase HpnC [Methylobacteriaceae bacterium]|nr:squalene synthase HpnC [Methylobacteriaceae bacterium]
MSAITADAADLRSGKGHGDENFPVASLLIHPRHRPAVLAFYRFVRTADDVADHVGLAAEAKLALLDRMGAALAGREDTDRSARALRAELAERGLDARHAFDLLHAFRTDVTKLRYADWRDLMGYCRYSAMPVGRFVLDVHRESESTWPASDALCAALQVINHLQDCAADYEGLDRVYLPLDALAAEGVGVEALAKPRASPALRRVIVSLTRRTTALLDQSRPFAGQIRDRRLAAEVAIIQALAERLTARLLRCDPLSERVHFSKPQAGWIALGAAARHWFSRRKSA